MCFKDGTVHCMWNPQPRETGNVQKENPVLTNWLLDVPPWLPFKKKKKKKELPKKLIIFHSGINTDSKNLSHEIKMANTNFGVIPAQRKHLCPNHTILR